MQLPEIVHCFAERWGDVVEARCMHLGETPAMRRQLNMVDTVVAPLIESLLGACKQLQMMHVARQKSSIK